MKLLDTSQMSRRGKIILSVSAVVIVVGIVALLAWLVMPFINRLSDPVYQAQFEAWVESLGGLGVLIMLFIQVLQVVIAFIPGEIIQVLCGVMYGTLGGLALCLFGCVIASSIVFLAIRKLGAGFVEKIVGSEKLKQYSFLNDTERLETLVFILFLVPAMPKDILTYIVPLSKISFPSFIVLSTLGRIPGMVASTLIGSSITDANWPLIIGIFVVVGIIGGLCIWKRDDLTAWAKRMGRVKHDAK